MATIPLTKRGAEKLKAELHRLKTVERPCGDPGHCRGARTGRPERERRVRRGQGQAGLHRRPDPGDRGQAVAAQVIDPAMLDAGGRVVFGATVDLEDEDTVRR
jgi:transcription elongation factor GreA